MATPTPLPPSTPQNAGSTPAAPVDTNYQLQKGESVPAYTSRVAAYNASKTAAAPEAPTAPTDGSTPSPYYSRTPASNPAADYLKGGSFQTPQTEDQIYSDKLKSAQGEIDSLNKYGADLATSQQQMNQQRTQNQNSTDVLNGLAGSTVATANNDKVMKQNTQDMQKVTDATAVKVQGLLSQIRQSAATEAQNQRTNAISGAKASTDYQSAQETQSSSHIKQLAETGVTPDGLKTSDPVAYQHLASSVGGESMLKALFTLNIPHDQIIDKKLEGGKYMVAYQNPLTQKISISTMDTGLPTTFSKTIDAGNRILGVPDNWDGNPAHLVTIEKGLTPKQQAAGAGGGAAGGVSPELQQAINDGTIDPNRLNSRTLGIYNAIAKAKIDAVSSHAEAAGKTKSVELLTTTLNTTNKTLKVLEANMPMLETLADKVNTSGVPGIDNYINGVKQYTGNDPDVIKYINALKTSRNEYAQMLAKGNAMTESDKAEAAQAIPAGKSGEAYRALHDQLKLEGTNIISASKSAIDEAKHPNQADAPTVVSQDQVPDGYYQASDGKFYKK